MPNSRAINPAILQKLLRYVPETGELLWNERDSEIIADARIRNAWNSKHSGKPALSYINSNGYQIGSMLGKVYAAHRVVWALHHNEWPSGDVDHINQNRRDNRIENLRAVSRSENARNGRIRRNNVSGVNGVHRTKTPNRWQATIVVNHATKYLGTFDSIEEAALARKKANAIYGYTELHGLSNQT